MSQQRVLPWILALAFLAGPPLALWALDEEETQRPQPAPSSSDLPPVAGGCDVGPWAEHCPEADWARAVIDSAGYGVVGDTGSAITGDANGIEFHLWGFPKEELHLGNYERSIARESYRPWRKVAGTQVYFDGIRFTWKVHGLLLWLTTVSHEGARSLPLETLVTTTVAAGPAAPR